MFSSLGCIPGTKKRQKAVNELARVVKKNGLVVIHAHNWISDFFKPKEFFWAFKNHFFRKPGFAMGDVCIGRTHQAKSYVHFYRPRELRHSFRKANLRITREFYINRKNNGFYKGILGQILSEGFIFVGRKK
jgi:ubiquinone/menaquinone biosynthesis C-methylase UbiE